MQSSFPFSFHAVLPNGISSFLPELQTEGSSAIRESPAFGGPLKPWPPTLTSPLARISHHPSAARTQVQPWLRCAAQFLLDVFTNTPADKSLALLATTELATSRDDVGEKYGLDPVQPLSDKMAFDLAQYGNIGAGEK